MAKKLLAIWISALIFFYSCPVALAESEEVTPIYITVYQGEKKTIKAYECGKDILFSAEDLAWMSGFDCSVREACTVYTRGIKEVVINYESASIGAMGLNYGIYLESECKYIDDTWYLSGAGVLPWLNVSCSEYAGELYVMPDTVSLWDIIGDFSWEDYSFNYEEICQSLGFNGKNIKAMSYAKNNGLKALLDLDLDNNNKTFTSEQRYYNLFDDMLKDTSATDSAAKQFKENTETIKSLGEIASLLNSEFKFFADCCDVVDQVAEVNFDYAVYCNLFALDNSRKISMLESLVGSGIYDDNRNMISGAKKVVGSYKDVWTGIFTRAAYKLIDYGNEALIDSVKVLNILDVAWPISSKVSEKIDRLGPYNTISNTCERHFDNGFYYYSYDEVTSMLDHIMLYLYCSEQSHLAMIDYCYDVRRGDYTVLKSLRKKAQNAEDAYAVFLAASENLENDSCSFNLKRDASKELLDLFGSIDRYPTASGIAAVAEEVIFMTEMMKSADWEGWTLIDSDEDGTDELIGRFYTTDAGLSSYTFMMNPATLSVIGSQNTDVFSRYGISWDYRFDNPDLTDVVVNGDTQALLAQLDGYFEERYGFVDKQEWDINDDGEKDRIYVLYDACGFWDNCADPYYFGYNGGKLTLLLAESVGEGVRLRSKKLSELPDNLVTEKNYEYLLSDADLSEYYFFDGDYVVLGDDAYTYAYSADGKPFKMSSGVTLENIVGFSKKEILSIDGMDFYEEDGLNFAYGCIDDATVEVYFNEYDEIKAVHVYPDEGSAFKISDEITVDMSRVDLWEKIPYTAEEWPNLSDKGKWDLEADYIYTAFRYCPPGVGDLYYDEQYTMVLYFEDPRPKCKVNLIVVSK